jgi:serine/threonine protein phosphatase PrpC
MEDAYSIENGGRFVAVFDGHGGSDVSFMLQERLYNIYRKLLSEKHWESRDGDSSQERRSIPSVSSHVGAIRGALEKIEKYVLKEEDLVYQGSTAVAVIMHVNENGGKTLLSANIGDSRAVLSRKGKAIELTRDHKPNDEREKARIRALGEDIQWDPYGQLYRVRDLSLSRAIGDRFAKPIVSSEAEIKHFLLAEEEDEFIILASDGLWDVMSSQEAVNYIHQSLRNPSSTSRDWNKDISRNNISKKVANEALERGSADNVCVIIVWLRDQASKK